MPGRRLGKKLWGITITSGVLAVAGLGAAGLGIGAILTPTSGVALGATAGLLGPAGIGALIGIGGLCAVVFVAIVVKDVHKTHSCAKTGEILIIGPDSNAIQPQIGTAIDLILRDFNNPKVDSREKLEKEKQRLYSYYSNAHKNADERSAVSLIASAKLAAMNSPEETATPKVLSTSLPENLLS